MEVVKVDFNNTKGIPPSGLCVGVHRAGAMHQKMVEKHGDGIAVWSLRPENDFIAFRSLEDEEGIRSTNDMDSIQDEKLIYGVRGAPPRFAGRRRSRGWSFWPTPPVRSWSSRRKPSWSCWTRAATW